MSRENVELVRGVIAANDRGDVARVFDAYDPAIEWHVARVAADIGDFEAVYRGHDGVRAFWRQWLSAWEAVAFEYEEFIDAGPNVVTILTQRMRGRTSGVELEWTSYAQVWTIREGQVTRVEFFPTRVEAVEACGVED